MSEGQVGTKHVYRDPMLQYITNPNPDPGTNTNSCSLYWLMTFLVWSTAMSRLLTGLSSLPWQHYIHLCSCVSEFCDFATTSKMSLLQFHSSFTLCWLYVKFQTNKALAYAICLCVCTYMCVCVCTVHAHVYVYACEWQTVAVLCGLCVVCGA